MKAVVEALKQDELVGLTELPTMVQKPWGSYATLKSSRVSVKRTLLYQGEAQSAISSSTCKHWLIARGKAIVQISDDEFETGRANIAIFLRARNID